MTRDQILRRYRRLRAISARHHSAIFRCVTQSTILENGRRLGLAVGNTLIADSEAELMLVFDLAIHSAKQGRSCAMDRYVKMARPRPGSEEALMLHAMRDARFSVWAVQRRHEVAGLIVADTLRETEAWLVDEGLEASVPNGYAFAARLLAPEGFAMTCGLIVPVDDNVFAEVSDNDPVAWRRGKLARVADDPRFATAIYRAALNCRTMERVRYRVPGDLAIDPAETASPRIPSDLPAPA